MVTDAKMRHPFLWMRTLAILLAVALYPLASIAADERPTMPALRVPDGSIKVDGRLDDWPAAAFAAPYERVTDQPEGHSHRDMTQAARGPWQGPDDLSFRVSAAVDSTHLYVAGTVRDQLLFNEGNADWPWVGDEFEIFIDANPPEQRFQEQANENAAQFIFVPVQLWPKQAGTFIWRPGKYPGVAAASRLTPLGYTFEIAIPLDVVPYWQAHHDLASIGFDVQVGDLDTPGLPGHDAGPKISLSLLQPFPHHLGPAHLATLAFDPAVTPQGEKGAPAVPALPGYSRAQELLDHADDADIATRANAALAQADLARKAALFLFSKRPELEADTAAIAAVLQEPAATTPTGTLCDARVYAMLALAARHQLPAAATLAAYGTSDDVILRHTALWAIGLNGDRAVVPDLVKLYPDSTGNDQEILAATLGRLGDPTGVPLLKAHAKGDHGQNFGDLCTELLKQLGVAE